MCYIDRNKRIHNSYGLGHRSEKAVLFQTEKQSGLLFYQRGNGHRDIFSNNKLNQAFYIAGAITCDCAPIANFAVAGDVSLDGSVDLSDAVFALRVVAGIVASDTVSTAADTILFIKSKMGKIHMEFEPSARKAHGDLLESLGISAEEITRIRPGLKK